MVVKHSRMNWHLEDNGFHEERFKAVLSLDKKEKESTFPAQKKLKLEQKPIVQKYFKTNKFKFALLKD